MQKSAREPGMEAKGVSEAALSTLVNLPWSGNVRQLENVCHYLTVMAPDHASCADAFTPAARLAAFVRAHWLRMPAHLRLHIFFTRPSSIPISTLQKRLDAGRGARIILDRYSQVLFRSQR